MAPSRASRRHSGVMRLRLSAGLAVLVAVLGVSACAEVPSNLVEDQPYELEPIEGTDLQRVTNTADNEINVELAWMEAPCYKLSALRY